MKRLFDNDESQLPTNITSKRLSVTGTNFSTDRYVPLSVHFLALLTLSRQHISEWPSSLARELEDDSSYNISSSEPSITQNVTENSRSQSPSVVISYTSGHENIESPVVDGTSHVIDKVCFGAVRNPILILAIHVCC